jgi:acyl-CoA reductase-like NAD-dependent aldehyde dehydrogenase
MTTLTTLNDVRAAMIARGYPADEVDAMLDLAGRMILEGSLATKDDLNRLRDEFTEFKLEVIERLAAHRVEFLHEISALRTEMNEKFAELRTETNGQFAELRREISEKLSAAAIDSRDRSSSSLKWMVGVVIGGIGVNAAVVGIGLAVVGLSAG